LTIGKYTWLFTTLALLFFGVAVVLYLKKKDCCTPQGIKNQWRNVAIAFVVLLIFLVLLKYWLAPLIATIAYR